MNFHAPNIDREPTAMEAADALATLRAWARKPLNLPTWLR